MSNDNPQAVATTSSKSASKTDKHSQRVLASDRPVVGTEQILASYGEGSLERSQQVNGSRYPFELRKDGTMVIGRALLQMVSITPVLLKDVSSIVVDATLGSHFYVTLAGNRTLSNPTGAEDGQRFTFEMIQDGTGSRTLTLGSKFAFGTTITSITLTTGANKRDFISCIYRKSVDKFYIVDFKAGY